MARSATRRPDFVKARDIDHARDGEVNAGLWHETTRTCQHPQTALMTPDRPGYYRKLLGQAPNEITVIDIWFSGFWMKSAYRIPDYAQPRSSRARRRRRSTLTKNHPNPPPDQRVTVRSFTPYVTDGAKLKPGSTR